MTIFPLWRAVLLALFVKTTILELQTSQQNASLYGCLGGIEAQRELTKTRDLTRQGGVYLFHEQS